MKQDMWSTWGITEGATASGTVDRYSIEIEESAVKHVRQSRDGTYLDRKPLRTFAWSDSAT